MVWQKCIVRELEHAKNYIIIGLQAFLFVVHGGGLFADWPQFGKILLKWADS